MIINEGGNVTGTVKKTKENTRAQKIPIKEIGRQEFIKKSLELFHNINQRFEKKFGEKLWKKEDELTSGFMFNGSTSFIMDPKLTDDEVISVKPSAGDFDIAIPEEHKENLWDLLDELEDKDLIPGVTYKGSNKPQKSSIGEQINTVFIMDFPNGVRAYAQVDFEALPFENDSPTEWAKFSHSSSFDDATIKVKAVFHKYIIRSLASSVSMRDDIVIATPASTKEKYKLKKVQEDDIPRMLKFSVSRGIRTAYEPLGIKDPDSGKEIYKEMKTTESNYTTIVADIYGLVFGDVEKNPGDVKLFNSFKGIVELMKKKLNKKQIDDSIFRLEQLLWDEKMGQELEVDDAKTDFDVKIAGYNYLMKELGRKMSPKTEKMLEVYYKDYGRRKSFVAENNINSTSNISFDDLKKDLFKFIRESKEQLDISILSAKKYLSSTAKIQKFFETPVLIEHKTDGVKISVIYTGNEEKPWIFAYKGMIIYDGEFEYASKPALKKSSISNSQFQIILDHFKKIPFEKISNFPGLRANHEFFIEFLMRKPTLSSNYHKSHGMVLIAHSPTKWKERFGRLISRPIDFITEDRNDFAKLLKIDVPQVLFKGILGSDNMFQNGIENSELKSLYAQQSKSFNWSNYEILLNQVQELFLTVESKYGGKEEGVVVKYLDGSDVLIKFQQDYQVDQNARAQIKDKWKGTPEEEDAYFKQVRLVALEIINQMNLTVKRPLQDFLQIASGLLKDQKLSIQHPIKDKINIQDDIYNTMKMIITKKMKGNNGALYLGKFRVLSSAHYKIIKDAIAVYDHVVVALVSSAETKETKDLRERMLKTAFPTLEIVHANSGNLFTIINKASSNINVVLAGSDRVAAYSKMLEKNPDIRVREIKRTDEDVSATKIVKAIKEDNFELFKSMTPKEIHEFYNELKNVYGLGTTIKEILKENELIERSNVEIANDILKIDHEPTLNKIDSILSIELIDKKIEAIVKNKKLPKKSVDSIKSFFERHSENINNKITLLDKIEKGIIKSLNSGTFKNITELISDSSVVKMPLFEDFVDFIAELTDSKDKQGSIGTGKGEVLLTMLCANGYLPSSKGDVNLFGKNIEVKASNGIIANWAQMKDIKETENFFKENLSDDFTLLANNLESLCKSLNSFQDKKLVKKAFIKYFEQRAVENFVKKEIKNIVKDLDFTTLDVKSIQTVFGKAILALYQESHGWDSILIFKESKNFLTTKLCLASSKSDFNSLVNFAGLGMSNGSRDAYLAVSPK